MKNCWKAALLSAFVFPGVGHFAIQKKVQGIIFASIATICLLIFLTTVTQIAQQISDQIILGEIPLSVERISSEIDLKLEQNNDSTINYAIYLLVICWIVSIIDSFRLGRILDKTSQDLTEK